jgi:hypothetical protein
MRPKRQGRFASALPEAILKQGTIRKNRKLLNDFLKNAIET